MRINRPLCVTPKANTPTLTADDETCDAEGPWADRTPGQRKCCGKCMFTCRLKDALCQQLTPITGDADLPAA